MKQIICYIIFIFFARMNTSFGQNHLPIAKENAIWFMEYLDHSTNTPQLKKYINFTSGDTLVNNQVYHKLYFQSMEIGKAKLIAGIRNDENSGKTKAILLTDTEIIGSWMDLTCSKTDEFELYDFSANIGETVGKECNTGGGVVSDTSKINLFGIERKLMTISSINQTWYEGIGSSSGLLSSLWNFSEYQLYDYCEGSFEECGVQLWLNTNIILAQERGKIFPNPSSGSLTVQVKEYIRDGQLIISDLYGQIVQIASFDALEKQINIEALPNGMYYIQVLDDLKLVYRGRVLLKK